MINSPVRNTANLYTLILVIHILLRGDDREYNGLVRGYYNVLTLLAVEPALSRLE
jgi:hypothetical protein